MNKDDKNNIEKAELFDQLEHINSNIEEIWHKLDTIAYFMQKIGEEGILGRELENAIVMMCRSQSKELDQEYKDLLKEAKEV